jgi:hypothetical protein
MEHGFLALLQLHCMTKLADYYCSLPSLSSALFAALHRSLGLIEEMSSVPEEFLVIAKKVRSDALFKEALIVSLGPFRQPKYLLLSDPALRDLAERKYNALTSQVFKFQGLLMGFVKYATRRSSRYRDLTPLDGYISFASGQHCWVPCWPECCRNMEAGSTSFFADYVNESEKSVIKFALGALLKNQLQFDKSGAQPGSGKFEDYFLCPEIGDEVLPWDLTEVDW